ncbi:MAG TPA: ABC transporter ATP-binding protein [Ilumatobacteraceae bacterium]
MAALELAHLTVRVANTTALDDVSLSVDDGELIGVVGASGAGKTSLLRAIAGLAAATAGTIRIDGVDVTTTEPAGRDVSMVFQNPALLPHRDVLGNVAFPLELHHEMAAEISTRVTAETKALHIEALLRRHPQQLSRGERQLVQVARAMVRTPSVLLLDEPLAALDAAMTQHLRLDLHALQRGYGVTTFLATSDPVEAMTLPDRLVVLDGGRVAQVGTPSDVYQRPSSLTAAACTGDVSTVTARIASDGDDLWLVHPAFRRRVPRQHLIEYVGESVVIAMRPTWAHLDSNGAVAATVTEASPGSNMITVSLGDDPTSEHITIRSTSPGHRRGDNVAFEIDEVCLFDPTTGARL